MTAKVIEIHWSGHPGFVIFDWGFINITHKGNSDVLSSIYD